ncbi:phage major capsid protein [Tranquillimonas alkanivorans]|uniref:Phage major capsid protein, HK97 family n=1 Tax=Tranquillimonas alkanivorans TaxID=441119 RepID=A0A1I5RWN5_9RHOB|nr:phage major capsid protein [Tranquillimonas alkanivorans]SFP62844.1 phage major capsid protein, HK97 family [Tranquillimonas alkanivorans]
MRHLKTRELLGSTALTLKDGGEDDPTDIVTKAVADLTKTVNDRLDEIEKKADTTKLDERIDKLEAKANRPGTGNTSADEDEQKALERKAFATYLRRGGGAPEEELKSLTVSNDEQGGYLAPAEMSSEFIRDLVEYSPIRSVASVRNITSASIKYPRRTGITNAQWEGEGEEAEESTTTFGQAEVTARKLMTYVDISNELLADSGGTAEQEVRLALAEDFGKKEGEAFVNGDGVKQPEGLMTHADIAHTVNGSTSNIDPDQLIKLMYAMPATYRNSGTWMMNGTTLGVIRTLKDADGRHLWQPSFQAGQPETILGRPVVEAVDMPDIASGAFPILYGDFSAYRIVDRLSMSILVNPYILATKGLTRIHATRRVGGRVLQAARFRKLKMSTS